MKIGMKILIQTNILNSFDRCSFQSKRRKFMNSIKKFPKSFEEELDLGRNAIQGELEGTIHSILVDNQKARMVDRLAAKVIMRRFPLIDSFVTQVQLFLVTPAVLESFDH